MADNFMVTKIVLEINLKQLKWLWLINFNKVNLSKVILFQEVRELCLL